MIVARWQRKIDPEELRAHVHRPLPRSRTRVRSRVAFDGVQQGDLGVLLDFDGRKVTVEWMLPSRRSRGDRPPLRRWSPALIEVLP